MRTGVFIRDHALPKTSAADFLALIEDDTDCYCRIGKLTVIEFTRQIKYYCYVCLIVIFLELIINRISS